MFVNLGGVYLLELKSTVVLIGLWISSFQSPCFMKYSEECSIIEFES